MSSAEEPLHAQLGVPEIDGQHRRIVQLIGRIEAGVQAGALDEARRDLAELERLLGHHFATEEQFMEASGYPGQKEHERAHADELEQVAALRAGAGRVAGPGPLLEALERLRRWLDGHVRDLDVRLARFHVARRNLRQLAESGRAGDLRPVPRAPRPKP